MAKADSSREAGRCRRISRNGSQGSQVTQQVSPPGTERCEPSSDPTQSRRSEDSSNSRKTEKTRSSHEPPVKDSSTEPDSSRSRSSQTDTRSSIKISELPSWLNSLLSEPEEVQQEVLLSLPKAQQLAALEAMRGTERRWRPLPGPQTEAYESKADVLLYGGAAGGGKTDLGLGLARYEHRRSLILRRVSPSLRAIVDRSREIYNPDGASAHGDSFNESMHRWRFADGCQVRFGSVQYDNDVKDYQGQPHDLLIFEEGTEFSEFIFRFLSGWNRTTVPGQRCRIVVTCNPPTTAEGEWVIPYWAPWLDPNHPKPARPGELRWFTTINGKDVEVESGEQFETTLADGRRETVYPRSRSFIPARVQDNPYLVASGYVSQLQSLPEPLRSKMLYGDFSAGREDAAYQVIPSEWVRLAQERWRMATKPTTSMSAMGVDVARGGNDRTVLTPRWDNYIGEPIVFPGKATPDGAAVASHVFQHCRDECLINIDVIGVGTSPYDAIRNGYVDADGDQVPGVGDRAVAMNGAEKSGARDSSGKLGFVNQRAEWWWKARESLDPSSGLDVALPPDPELRADLCAPTWKTTVRGIQVEAKEDLTKRLHRSPDKGDSCVYAMAIKSFAGSGILGMAREENEKQKKLKEQEQREANAK